MALRSDRPQPRVHAVTRSGRSVKPPIRYEPDTDQEIEDDYSEEEGESDWGCLEEAQPEDADSTSTDSSYQSVSDSSSSSSEGTDAGDTSSTDRGEVSTSGDEEEEEEDCVEDVLAWETLTADASEDCYSSADDQDL